MTPQDVSMCSSENLVQIGTWTFFTKLYGGTILMTPSDGPCVCLEKLVSKVTRKHFEFNDDSTLSLELLDISRCWLSNQWRNHLETYEVVSSQHILNVTIWCARSSFWKTRQKYHLGKFQVLKKRHILNNAFKGAQMLFWKPSPRTPWRFTKSQLAASA